MKLTLPSGSSPYGAQMGRRNVLPDDLGKDIKLRLTRFRWVSGDYDQWGAYWGRTPGEYIYCAWGGAFVFVRAASRSIAKDKVWEILPNARFYR